MKKRYFLLVLATILISSCSNKQEPTFQEDGTLLIFFTDDGHFEKEISYYDAILEIRKTYPTLVSNMKIVTPHDIHRLDEYLQVQQFPALLITVDNEIIFSVEGSTQKEKIIEPIINLLAE